VDVTVQRGDVVLAAAPGDFGKPRPALVVQSNLFNETHASVTVCPLTSTLVDAPLFRISVSPSERNGLGQVSQVMVDKVQSLRRDRIGARVGAIDAVSLSAVDTALRRWLNV
jgi:mRNA interferase MazF